MDLGACINGLKYLSWCNEQWFSLRAAFLYYPSFYRVRFNSLAFEIKCAGFKSKPPLIFKHVEMILSTKSKSVFEDIQKQHDGMLEEETSY